MLVPRAPPMSDEARQRRTAPDRQPPGAGRRPPRWPPPVRPGARVGVAALSGPVDVLRLEAGLEQLRALGLEPVVAANVRSRHGLFAGPDEARLAGFHELVADPGIEAVFFARGGHGLLRLLPRLDWRALRRRPLALVGYSDLTPLLLEVVTRLGWITFHGPMLATDFATGLTELEATSLLAALAGETTVQSLPGVPLGERREQAEGWLLGGCLTLLAATVGTRWRPRLADALLFLEDVGEPAYRLDRMLVQLELAGALEGVRGLLVGHLAPPVPWAPAPGSRAEEATPDARLGPLLDSASRDVLQELVRRRSLLAASRLAAGHGRPNLTLPLGAWARLEVSAEQTTLHCPWPSPHIGRVG
jgi:muramoyltetrapeptide carboxypeptidase